RRGISRGARDEGASSRARIRGGGGGAAGGTVGGTGGAPTGRSRNRIRPRGSAEGRDVRNSRTDPEQKHFPWLSLSRKATEAAPNSSLQAGQRAVSSPGRKAWPVTPSTLGESSWNRSGT